MSNVERYFNNIQRLKSYSKKINLDELSKLPSSRNMENYVKIKSVDVLHEEILTAIKDEEEEIIQLVGELVLLCKNEENIKDNLYKRQENTTRIFNENIKQISALLSSDENTEKINIFKSNTNYLLEEYEEIIKEFKSFKEIIEKEIPIYRRLIHLYNQEYSKLNEIERYFRNLEGLPDIYKDEGNIGDIKKSVAFKVKYKVIYDKIDSAIVNSVHELKNDLEFTEELLIEINTNIEIMENIVNKFSNNPKYCNVS